ncbi:hypothetical protein GLAREA_01387 [Glarea lozoyensis ATCC 20868]|uniref:BZIP domain-containing protein n=1 Tax=Glarea lozoyensis (strain ATCC 20868 / MF5171) TaxID=1116229 RepID=S3CHZ5_GLAL2|nr:uncharacterized protein GLAREA_01387 [Glarea lozoyensis ATCC 20868]EPE25475.1 hypothetical protein GLAREA_01387 [Glarea lozoyensis ATCC 20868]
MQARPEIWRKDDDWSTIKEHDERKKRQNRLNQRAYRKRNEKTEADDGKPRPFKVERFRISELSTPSREDKSQEQLLRADKTLKERDNNSRIKTAVVAKLAPGASTTPLVELEVDSQELFESFLSDPPDITPLSAAIIASIRSTTPPCIVQPIEFPLSSDHLIHLIHYNVYRALITNKQLLKSRTYLTKLDNQLVYPSHLDLCEGLSFLLPKEQASLPSNLEPTAVQMNVPHSSWLNMFPYPKIRDNLIARQYHFNQLDLCNDLWGEWFIADLGNLVTPRQPTPEDDDDVTAGRTGMIVWGDSWDPAGWEVTEAFVRKWAWVVEGCEEIFASTNVWRAKRELAPLDFSALRVSSPVSVENSEYETQVSTGSWEEILDSQQGEVWSCPRLSGMPTPTD